MRVGIQHGVASSNWLSVNCLTSDPSGCTATNFRSPDIGLKITPLQRLHAPDEGIDVSVEQVYFQALQLPVSVKAASIGRARVVQANGSRALKPGAPPVTTATITSGQVTIPQTGSYYIWVQRVASASPSDPTQITVSDDTGQAGRALSYSSPNDSAWGLVGSLEAGAAADAAPQPFLLSEGTHTIQVRAAGGYPKAVRLLITNDRATTLPPVISAIPDQVVENCGVLTVPFFVTAIGESASDLDIRVSCQDAGFIPDSSLSLAVQGSEGVLAIQPPCRSTGKTEMYIIATDRAGRLATQSFSLTVR